MADQQQTCPDCGAVSASSFDEPPLALSLRDVCFGADTKKCLRRTITRLRSELAASQAMVGELEARIRQMDEDAQDRAWERNTRD